MDLGLDLVVSFAYLVTLCLVIHHHYMSCESIDRIASSINVYHELVDIYFYLLTPVVCVFAFCTGRYIPLTLILFLCVEYWHITTKRAVQKARFAYLQEQSLLTMERKYGADREQLLFILKSLHADYEPWSQMVFPVAAFENTLRLTPEHKQQTERITDTTVIDAAHKRLSLMLIACQAAHLVMPVIRLTRKLAWIPSNKPHSCTSCDTLNFTGVIPHPELNNLLVDYAEQLVACTSSPFEKVV